MTFPKELSKARRQFTQHRRNASLRGVEWQFTFEQWWKVWQDSGHWAERGWGADKYCMCRVGDVGPYAAANVFIATNSENSRAIDRSNRRRPRWKALPVGVRTQAGKYYATRCVGGVYHHLGTFATPELAHAAYQSYPTNSVAFA